jgi:hypothetical protein
VKKLVETECRFPVLKNALRVACTQLSKHCANVLPKTSPTHLVKLFSQGRSKNECCSGTFLIHLANDIKYLPELKAHIEFIQRAATTPMCFN